MSSQVEVSATDRSLVERDPTDSCVSLCDLATSRMRPRSVATKKALYCCVRFTFTTA